jgi:hypothetical protein
VPVFFRVSIKSVLWLSFGLRQRSVSVSINRFNFQAAGPTATRLSRVTAVRVQDQRIVAVDLRTINIAISSDCS